jgi:anti-anti-sigma factor
MEIRLIAESGPGRGQALEVAGKLFIGRDSRCQIRPSCDALAGIHALVETRGDHVFVRDCGGSEAGTTINDRVIHETEVAVFDGDRLVLGDLAFTLRIGPRDPLESNVVDHVPEGWPLVAAGFDEPRTLDADRRFDPIPETLCPERAIAFEVPAPGDVLIIRVLATDLNDDTTISPLRNDLQSLSTDELPMRAVIDLGAATFIASRAVGVLLAYFQRLDRIGGTLRICRVAPKVMPVLHQMRLDRLIDIYETVDAAVEADWT